MVLFSLSFWYAFSATEYSSKAWPRTKPLNIMHAIADALNPSDLFLGIARIFGLAAGDPRRSGKYADTVGRGSVGTPSYAGYNQPMYAPASDTYTAAHYPAKASPDMSPPSGRY